MNNKKYKKILSALSSKKKIWIKLFKKQTDVLNKSLMICSLTEKSNYSI